MQHAAVPVTQLILVGFLVLVALGLWLAARHWYVRWRLRFRWSHAQAAEAAAPKLLQKLGYDVLGAQVQGSYSLLVDGQPLLVSLRADYLVSRDGQQFVAEVKSGKFAPLLRTAATRRQLLEYLIAFQVDGVLLVDGETKQVHEVVFPTAIHPAATAWMTRALPYLVGLLLLLAVIVVIRLY